MEIETISDHDLLQQYRCGLADAATLLYGRYADRIRKLAVREISSALASLVDPEDIVQSVFHNFFRRVVEGRYAVAQGEEIWALLRVITLNKIRALGNYHRAGRRDMRRTVRGKASDHAVGAEFGQDEYGITLLRLVVDEAIQALPPDDQSIVQMRVEGYQLAEIAEHSHRSKRTVERVIQEFRRRLDTRLRKGA